MKLLGNSSEQIEAVTENKREFALELNEMKVPFLDAHRTSTPRNTWKTMPAGRTSR
jgi:hypothetical protein